MKWVMIAIYIAAQSGDVVEKQQMQSFPDLDTCLAQMHQREFTFHPMPDGANAVIFYCDQIDGTL